MEHVLNTLPCHHAISLTCLVDFVLVGTALNASNDKLHEQSFQARFNELISCFRPHNINRNKHNDSPFEMKLFN